MCPPFAFCCLIEKHSKLVHRGNGGRPGPEAPEGIEDQRWDIWKQCHRLSESGLIMMYEQTVDCVLSFRAKRETQDKLASPGGQGSS